MDRRHPLRRQGERRTRARPVHRHRPGAQDAPHRDAHRRRRVHLRRRRPRARQRGTEGSHRRGVGRSVGLRRRRRELAVRASRREIKRGDVF